jgi:cytochrome c553
MKKVALTTLLVSGLALSAYAMPASYGKCVGCHGAKGERAFGSTPDKVPSNLTKAQVETALHGYKDGSYGGAQKMLMKGQVMSLSDAQIKEIAAYIGK